MKFLCIWECDPEDWDTIIEKYAERMQREDRNTFPQPRALEYDIRTTTECEVTYQGEKCSLKILSDSTILELDYEEDLYVNLTVTGPYDTPGFVNISIPRDLVPEELNIPVTLDGSSIFDSIVEDSNIIHLSLTYNHTRLQHLINVDLSNIEEETESEKRGIPGFPIFAISIGIILSLIILGKVRS